ncbi:MAG: Verru_Chthon cassette protein D [Verrucomicrobiales bacterium]|nr:Verru_Chthon cassette protein D [Verrucomicrobiales bacterium]
MKKHRSPYSSAFSLLELLTVLTIVSIVLAFSIAAVPKLSITYSLTHTGDQITDFLTNARQQAVAKNRSVEVRFYNLKEETDDDLIVTLVQSVQHIDNGNYVENSAHIGELEVEDEKTVYLPSGIGISRNPVYTSFFRTGRTTKGLIRGKAANSLPDHPDATFTGFRFNPDGSTELPAGKWFLTIIPEVASRRDEPPPNFYTIQIDPAVGRVRVFRP